MCLDPCHQGTYNLPPPPLITHPPAPSTNPQYYYPRGGYKWGGVYNVLVRWVPGLEEGGMFGGKAS